MVDQVPPVRLGSWRAEPATAGTPVRVAVAEPATVTLAVVRGSQGCLVVDTGSTPQQGRALAAAVAALTPVPVTDVVVTHWHVDHAFGLRGLTSGPHASALRSHAHPSVAARLRSPDVAAAARQLGFDAAELAVPEHPVTDRRSLDLGDVRVDLLHPGPAHTDGDLVVLVAPEGRDGAAPVALVGDLVETASPPWYGDDADALGWPDALEHVVTTLEELGDDVVVIPGHGPACDLAEVRRQRDATRQVAEEIRAGHRAGREPSEIAARGRWPYPVAHVEAAIGPAVAALAADAGGSGR